MEVEHTPRSPETKYFGISPANREAALNVADTLGSLSSAFEITPPKLGSFAERASQVCTLVSLASFVGDFLKKKGKIPKASYEEQVPRLRDVFTMIGSLPRLPDELRERSHKLSSIKDNVLRVSTGIGALIIPAIQLLTGEYEDPNLGTFIGTVLGAFTGSSLGYLLGQNAQNRVISHVLHKRGPAIYRDFSEAIKKIDLNKLIERYLPNPIDGEGKPVDNLSQALQIDFRTLYEKVKTEIFESASIYSVVHDIIWELTHINKQNYPFLTEVKRIVFQPEEREIERVDILIHEVQHELGLSDLSTFTPEIFDFIRTLAGVPDDNEEYKQAMRLVLDKTITFTGRKYAFEHPDLTLKNKGVDPVKVATFIKSLASALVNLLPESRKEVVVGIYKAKDNLI